MIKKNIVIRYPVEDDPVPGSYIQKALQYLPQDVVNIVDDLVFSASTDKVHPEAMLIPKEDFGERKYQIHIERHTWDLPEMVIIRVILHEIAHAYFGHSSPIAPSASREEGWYEKQELDADVKVAEWMGKGFPWIEEDKEKGIKKPKLGRNDPCSCWSGKKHKKCCGA